MFDTTEELRHAVWLRSEIKMGLRDQEWRREQVRVMIRKGFWSDRQIAQISGYSRQSVVRFAADETRPEHRRRRGGNFVVEALDLCLELRRNPNPNLLRKAVATGMGTRLLSDLTGISLGKILYAQRTIERAPQ